MTNGDTVRFTFRLPKELMQQLKDTAYSKGCSVNAFILQILWDWVDRNKERKKNQ